MAGVEKEQRRNTQVEETINKLYNEIKDKNIPLSIVNSIGDYLDRERQISSGFSWTDVKGGAMSKTKLISKFKHYSRKTYTSREIFLNLLEKWNPTICAGIKSFELENTLKYLNQKNRKFCSLEEFTKKEPDCMFETLSSAFMEEPDMMQKKIKKALRDSPTKYKKYDTNGWITTPLMNRWDPLVFYICANIQERVISIKVDETQEYRIFPDETPKFPFVRFLQIEQFKYVHLPDVVGARGEIEEHTGETDFKASKDYLENQLEKFKRFFYPKEAEKNEKKVSNLDEDPLIEENREMVDKTLSIVQKQKKEIAEKDQTIDETVEEFDNVVSKLKQKLKSVKSQPDTTEKQPNHELYRQTDTCFPEKDFDHQDINLNHKPRSKTDSFNSQRDVHDNQEAYKGGPVDDKPQKERKKNPDQNKPEQHITSGICYAEAQSSVGKKKKGSMVSRLSQEKTNGSDASYRSEPRTGTLAGRSKSATTFTSHR